MDWTWQLKNLVTTPEQLAEHIPLSDQEMEAIREASKIFPMAITPYYLGLMDKEDPECPIRLQAIPSGEELESNADELEDPLGEELDSPVPGLTHRYPDRALLLVTNRCFVFCRHCNRRRKVGSWEQAIGSSMVAEAIAHIRSTPQIRDVLVSGGDPLFMQTGDLEEILRKLKSIEHVRTIRIGTRVPVVLPQRVTDELVEMIRRYHPVWINTHFNHPKELTTESRRALANLADAGIPLGNQAVLLAGVNDCPTVLRDLFLGLVECRVRPYYLFQCDLAKGTTRFRTPIARGMEIMESLIGHVSGYAVPKFAVDPPGGVGKIPLSPNYLLSSSPEAVVLRNYEGTITRYPDNPPQGKPCPRGCELCDSQRTDGSRRGADDGVGGVLGSRGAKALSPSGGARARRRKN